MFFCCMEHLPLHLAEKTYMEHMGWSLNDAVRWSPMVNWLPHLLEVRAGHEEHVPLGRYSSGRNLGREGNIFRFVAWILNEMLHLFY